MSKLLHWQLVTVHFFLSLHLLFSLCTVDNEKALRDTQTLRALAVVRFGHRPPAVTNPQTGPITIHCAAAS